MAPKPPSYLHALLAHLASAPLEGSVTHVEVRHDDWCGIFRDADCDCAPQIVSGPSIQAKYEAPEPTA